MSNLVQRISGNIFSKEAFISIGNIHLKYQLFTKTFSSYKMCESQELVICDESGDMEDFTNCVKSRIDKNAHKSSLTYKNYLSFFEKTIVSFDSSAIMYKLFEFDQDSSIEQIFESIKEMCSDKKILHHNTYGNNLCILTIRNNFIGALKKGLESININATDFVSEKYIQAYSLNKKHGSSRVNMVLNIGYRSTNISIFDNDFLIYYETINTGLESIVLAFKEKTGFSVRKSEELIEETPLTGYTEQMKYKIPEILSFYFSSFVRKILYFRNMPRYHEIICTGVNTPGFDKIIEHFASKTKIVKIDFDTSVEFVKNKIFHMKP